MAEKLLKKYSWEGHSSVSINHQNLQKMAVEMFKVSRCLSPEIVNELFEFREQTSYN